MKKEIYEVQRKHSKTGRWHYWMTYGDILRAINHIKETHNPKAFRIIKQTTVTKIERRIVK